MLALASIASRSYVIGSAPAVHARASINMATQDELKKQVGYKAVDDYVKSGMVIGLGTYAPQVQLALERFGQLAVVPAPYYYDHADEAIRELLDLVRARGGKPPASSSSHSTTAPMPLELPRTTTILNSRGSPDRGTSSSKLPRHMCPLL